VEPHLQQVEIQTVWRDDDDLAVDHAAGRQLFNQCVAQLREISLERPQVPTLDMQLTVSAKDQRAEAVPLWFEQILAGRRNLLADFRWLLLSATFATIVGAFLIPTFQRFFSRAVQEFQIHRSIPRLLLHICFRGGLAQIKDSVSVPASGNVTALRAGHSISVGTVALNVVAVALWTVGVFAALYAGYLNPQLRVTSSTLSAIVNGLATILMFVIIDPQLSVMTDDVVEGRLSEPTFRRAIVWLVGSRFAGTLLAQLLLIPAASLIVFVAERL